MNTGCFWLAGNDGETEEETEEPQGPKSRSLHEFEHGENTSDIKPKTETLLDLQVSDQFPEVDDNSQFNQRQAHHPNGRRRDVCGSTTACDVTYSGDELSRETQRRVTGICPSTTQNDLIDFTEEMSGREEVKEVLIEGEEDVRADELSDIGTAVYKSSKAQMRQQPEAKTQQIQITVDPDVMEYVTSTEFEAQLSNSLALKDSEIIWKPNNEVAVIVYRGEDDSDSWQFECIDEVKNFLDNFAKCDVQVNEDFWEAVLVQLPSISACLGFYPPMIKTINESCIARIVSLDTDVKSNEEMVKSELEEIYRDETRKSRGKKRVPNVPEERLTLLKKIDFVEKLQQKNKELKIKLDIEKKEISFEGPKQQVTEATIMYDNQMENMVEKKLAFSDSILEVLSSDEGLQTVKRELESNNVEAVFVIDRDARIVGTAADHADKAVGLVNKLMLEEKVQVDEKSNHLLKSPGWIELCKEINTQSTVRVYGNDWNDTYVAGFRKDVAQVIKKLSAFLENNCIRQERFVCSSDIVRGYLIELRHEDLSRIEDSLKGFTVKIETGKDGNKFEISGTNEGLKRAKEEIAALVKNIKSETFVVKQAGLLKFFDSGKGDRLVKSVGKEYCCTIQVQKNFVQKDKNLRSESVSEDDDDHADSDDEDHSSDNYGDDDDEDDDNDDSGCSGGGGDGDEAAAAVATDKASASGTDALSLVTVHGHKISWKPGYIETEKVNVLLCDCFVLV